MEKIKIAICDDMKFICEYFSMVLQVNEMFDVVGIANDHDAVMALAREKRPDVVLLDLNFDKNNAGIEMIPELKEINPECKVIIITVHDQGNLILDAITNGADNYLLKDLPIEEYAKQMCQDSIKKVPKVKGESKRDERMRELTYLNLKWFMITLLRRNGKSHN